MATILLIERDGVSRKLAARILQYAGHRVVQGAHGREAVELARRHRPQLVIIAVEPAAEEALRAVRGLRGDAELAGLRVHAMVTRAVASQHKGLLDAEFDGILSKPFDQRQLFRFADTQLRRRP